ncbi:MAG: hypothetical protein M1832_003199 [Thelocarpon impressellum]|nr:MAG: hypothetical protein M1832_003199 [Thelocarpon impressellum]
MTTKDMVKETVAEEVQRVRAISEEAARSGAYLYPLKGIAYFFTHRGLWKPLLSRIVPTITLAVGVITFMFVFAYFPQAAIMTIFNGPLAAFSAIVLTLSESSTLITILSKTFLIEDALIDSFDGTLALRNQTHLVSQGRQIKSGGGDPVAKLGKIAKKPFQKFAPKAIIRYILYLPLNFIPVVGTLIFLVLQGRRNGATAHARYFNLKSMPPSQAEEWVQKRQGAYTSFGLVATALELVPVASIFFSFTNTVGAALWAADIESGSTTAPNLRVQASKAE